MASLELSPDPTFYGADSFACFYPTILTNWFNTEPSKIASLDNDVKLLITGTKQLGAMMQAGFVGEEVDTRWFGAVDAPDDWGDSTGGGGSFTHTYHAPGIYWLTAASSGAGANAARMIKIIKRGRPPASYFETWKERPIYTYDYGYGVAIDPVSEGSIDSAVAVRFQINMTGLTTPDENIGYTVPQGGFAVFMEAWDGDNKCSRLFLVTGGFISNRTLTLTETGDTMQGTAYDVLYYVAQQEMGEQQYNDAASMAMLLAVDASQQLNITDNNFSASDPMTAITKIDILGLGYEPMHFLNACRPDYAVAHMISHIHVSFIGGAFNNPKMWSTDGGHDYGTLAQFTNFRVDSEYDEKVQQGGFHAFNVTTGNVLSNMRQMLENTGSTLFVRNDTTIVMSQKPFYQTTLPEARVLIEPDSSAAVSPILIAETVAPNIYQIQLERPFLGMLQDANPSGSGDSCSSAYGTMDIIAVALSCGEQPEFCTTSIPPAACATTMLDASQAAQDSLNNARVNDAAQQSIDPNSVLAKVNCGNQATGAIIGPVPNIFSNDLEAFGRGMCKEKRAHMTVVIPLGDVYDVDLGDLVAVTYSTRKGWYIEWSQKLFWVTKAQLYLDQAKHTRQITAIEIDPDNLADGALNSGGGCAPNTTDPGPPSTPSALNVMYYGSVPETLGGVSLHPEYVGLGWSLTCDPGVCAPAGSYVCEVYINGALWTTSPSNYAQVQGLALGTSYTAFVQIRTSCGAVSAKSNVITFTTRTS